MEEYLFIVHDKSRFAIYFNESCGKETLDMNPYYKTQLQIQYCMFHDIPYIHVLQENFVGLRNILKLQ